MFLRFSFILLIVHFCKHQEHVSGLIIEFTYFLNYHLGIEIVSSCFALHSLLCLSLVVPETAVKLACMLDWWAVFRIFHGELLCDIGYL